MTKRNIGFCPVCEYPVHLGSRNRTLAHAQVRRGLIVGNCPGSGKTATKLAKAAHFPSCKPNLCKERWSREYARKMAKRRSAGRW